MGTPGKEGPICEVDRSMAGLLPLDYCLDNRLVLLASEQRSPDAPLKLGMSKAGDRTLAGAVSSKLGRSVVPVEMSGIDVRRALARRIPPKYLPADPPA